MRAFIRRHGAAIALSAAVLLLGGTVGVIDIADRNPFADRNAAS